MDKKSDSDLIFMYLVNTLIGISDFISLKYQKSYIKNLEDVVIHVARIRINRSEDMIL